MLKFKLKAGGEIKPNLKKMEIKKRRGVNWQYQLSHPHKEIKKPETKPKHERNYCDWLKEEVRASALNSKNKRIILKMFYNHPDRFVGSRGEPFKIHPQTIIKHFLLNKHNFWATQKNLNKQPLKE